MILCSSNLADLVRKRSFGGPTRSEVFDGSILFIFTFSLVESILIWIWGRRVSCHFAPPIQLRWDILMSLGVVNSF